MQIYNISDYTFDEIVFEPKSYKMRMYDMIYDAALECNVSIDVMWFHMQKKQNTQRELLRQKSTSLELKQSENINPKQIVSFIPNFMNEKKNWNNKNDEIAYTQMSGILNSCVNQFTDVHFFEQFSDAKILNDTNKYPSQFNQSYYPIKITHVPLRPSNKCGNKCNRSIKRHNKKL